MRKGIQHDSDNKNWTIEQEAALNCFADFMASMIEKYGPTIDSLISDKENDEKIDSLKASA